MIGNQKDRKIWYLEQKIAAALVVVERPLRTGHRTLRFAEDALAEAAVLLRGEGGVK